LTFHMCIGKKAMDYETALSVCRYSFRTSEQRQLAYALEKSLVYAKEAGKEAELLTDVHIRTSLDTLRLAISCGWPIPLNTISSTTIKVSHCVEEPLIIFVDGSCLNNGKANARAAYGIYVTKDGAEVWRHAAALAKDEPQTNQRAELQALAAALSYVSEGNRSAKIYTDSMYAVNILLVWGPQWIKNGWRKSDGKPVLHTDILVPLYDLWTTLGTSVSITHVIAHTGGKDFLSRGNAVADELAVSAATVSAANKDST